MMDKECMHIIKSRGETNCSLCGTSIEIGKICLAIFSKKEGVYQNVKFHLECIPSLIKTIKLLLKEEVIKELKRI